MEPIIETTENGWVWITEDGEEHELHAMFATVHVRTPASKLREEALSE